MNHSPATTLPLAAHAQPPKTGVLLVNLGTPEAPTKKAIRAYLKEFLSDTRVVDVEPALWWPILNLIILNTRPKKLAAKYAAIWTPEGGPLVAIGRRQAAGIAMRLAALTGSEVPVALAMRYGVPAIETALAALDAQGVRRIVLLPLFPQYSASTTAAVLDAVFSALGRRRWLPELTTINQYHDDAGYIAALAASIEAHWSQRGRGEHLLMSFHGIPQRYFDLGDPYYCHCQKTARLLAAALGLSAGQWSLSFQSRFGKEEWIKPYTDAHLKVLAARGIKTLDVIAPGFAADCLETLEEIAVEYRDEFSALGGTLRYVPALNDEAPHLDALAQLLASRIDSTLIPQTR
ncbi:MAG: ferrochelatase [Pseudomonadota bacterium]